MTRPMMIAEMIPVTVIDVSFQSAAQNHL